MITFTHTVVEDAYEGQGIGGELARSALDDARAGGGWRWATLPLHPAWIDRHPDYADLVRR